MNIFTNAKEVILRLKLSVIEARQKTALITALDLIALVKLRIQTEGRDANNQSFVPYTLPYAKDRQNFGAQTGFVDFTRTGRMWASIRPEIIEDTIEKTVVEIKSRTAEGQAKLNGQFKKRGNILLPTNEEIEIILGKHLDEIISKADV